MFYCAYFTAFIVLCILYKGHRLKHVNGDERDPYTQTPQTHPSMTLMMRRIVVVEFVSQGKGSRPLFTLPVNTNIKEVRVKEK